MHRSLKDQWVNIIFIKCGLILCIVAGFNEQAGTLIFFAGLLSFVAGCARFFKAAN
mgnify:CR=1